MPFSTKSYDTANECVLVFNCSVSDSKLKYSSDNMLFKLLLKKSIQDELSLIRCY